MAIKISDNIQINTSKPVDNRYLNNLVPYADTTEAKTIITAGVRYSGLTINVSGTEYWWKDGLDDVDLVEKTTGGGGGITGATNGLSVSGDNVILGGTLTGDTIINVDSNSLSITGGTVNIDGITTETANFEKTFTTTSPGAYEVVNITGTETNGNVSSLLRPLEVRAIKCGAIGHDSVYTADMKAFQCGTGDVGFLFGSLGRTYIMDGKVTGQAAGTFAFIENTSSCTQAFVMGLSALATNKGADVTNFRGVSADIAHCSVGTIGTATGLNTHVYNCLGGTITIAEAVFGKIDNRVSSCIVDAVALHADIGNAGDITNVTGLLVGDWSDTGTITNSYGIKIDDTIDVGTNRYSIFSESTSPAHFDGNIVAPIVSGTTCVRFPTVCASTKVNAPIISGSTCLNAPRICSTICSTTPLACATTCVTAPAIVGTTCARAPIVCGSTCVQSPILYANTCVCSSVIYAQNTVCAPYVCGTIRGRFTCLSGTTCTHTSILCTTNYVDANGTRVQADKIIFDADASTKVICAPTNATPATVCVVAGTSTDASVGGGLYLKAGNNNSTIGNGGTLFLCAGRASTTCGTGGNAYIYGGQGYGAGASFGGSIFLNPGLSANASYQGKVLSYYCGQVKTCTTANGLTVNGDVTCISDSRMKKNQSPILNPLSIISDLCGLCFDYCLDNIPSVGLIAQEVEEVFPIIVKKGVATEFDSDCYGIDEGSDVYTLNYGGLTPVLIEAVKELKLEVEALKEEIGLLKSQ